MKYSFIDDLGTIHVFDKTPQRIVSLVPSQTELIVDLGLESSLVGITKFCVHPIGLRKKKTIVGGTKKVNYEKIKALLPDIIICNKEENTLEIVENLRSLCPIWVTNIITIEDNFKMINDFGKLLNCEDKAQDLNNKMNLALNEFKQFIKHQSPKTIAYFIWKNPYMVAGSNNFINELLLLNGFENAFANEVRYPEINIEKLNKDNNIDCVFLSSEPYPFKEKDILEIVPFCDSVKIILVDGEMFSWYGSRLIKAFKYFTFLHQNL